MPLDQAAQQVLDRLIDERRAEARTYLPGTHDFPIGRAEGSWVFDEIGNPYLDFGPGGAVNILGHNNPRVMQYISDHLRFYTYTGDDHLSRFSVEYAKALSERFPEPRQVQVLSSLDTARRRARVMLAGSDNEDPPSIRFEKHAGFGRTGKMWSHQWEAEEPDILVLGPAGGGGFPYAAIVAPPELFETVGSGSMDNHPVVCAAALAVLEQITPELLAHVTTMGEVLTQGIAELAAQFPAIGTLNGVGLLQKLQIQNPEQAQKFREDCRAKGLLMHHDLGLTPPLTVSEQEVGQAVDIMADVLLDWS
jgi:4-aminobutyrate aminotransferase-like enzyme